MQTPLYEEFYNSFNAAVCSPSFLDKKSPSFLDKKSDETSPNYLKLPPKSRSPSRVPGTPSKAVDAISNDSPGSNSKHVLNVGNSSDQSAQENSSPQCINEAQPDSCSPGSVLELSVIFVFLFLIFRLTE